MMRAATAMGLASVLGLPVYCASTQQAASNDLSAGHGARCGTDGARGSRKMGQMLHLRGGGDEVRGKFKVRADNTKPGDSVVILGKGQEVGDNNGEYLAKLTTSKSDFPWWHTELVVPVGERIEYKFAIRNPSGQMQWKKGTNTLSFSFESRGGPDRGAVQGDGGTPGTPSLWL